MPANYSIFDNTIYYSIKYDLLEDIIYQLPDNDQKLIEPQHIRDAIFTLHETDIFKITHVTNSQSNIFKYVGINNENIINKIYWGKKSFLSNNILSGVLLDYNNNDTDLFIYNNKPDWWPNQNTKISFIAGNNSSLYNNAPFISVRKSINNNLNDILQFDFINNSGDITINSTSEYVILNGVKLPKINDTINNATNGSILVYNSSNNSLEWYDNNFFTQSININGQLNIYGNPVIINNNNIEFSDTRPIINGIRSIQAGQTFNNVPLTEMLRQMLYEYNPPECELQATPSVVEKGQTNTTITLKWKIHKKTDPVINISFPFGNVVNFISPAPINTPGLTTVSSPPHAQGIIPNSGFSASYVIKVMDDGSSNGGVPTTVYATASITIVYPYFYGVSQTNATNYAMVNSILGSLNKLVETKSNKQLNISGYGYVYFIYPMSSGSTIYGTLNNILDENDNPITMFNLYQYSNPGLTSPNYYWSNIPYYVYKIGPVSIDPNYPVVWKFNY